MLQSHDVAPSLYCTVISIDSPHMGKDGSNYLKFLLSWHFGTPFIIRYWISIPVCLFTSTLRAIPPPPWCQRKFWHWTAKYFPSVHLKIWTEMLFRSQSLRSMSRVPESGKTMSMAYGQVKLMWNWNFVCKWKSIRENHSSISSRHSWTDRWIPAHLGTEDGLDGSEDPSGFCRQSAPANHQAEVAQWTNRNGRDHVWNISNHPINPEFHVSHIILAWIEYSRPWI